MTTIPIVSLLFAIPVATRQTNRQILRLLVDAPDSHEISDAKFHEALTEHKRVPLSVVRYEVAKPV